VINVLVNHLTRMKDDRVCIAGLGADGLHVRPLLPRHRPWTDDHVHPRGPIRLGSWLSMDGAFRPNPPHTEDLVLDAWDVVGQYDYDVFLTELRSAVVPLAECFGTAHNLVPGPRRRCAQWRYEQPGGRTCSFCGSLPAKRPAAGRARAQ
jgi:hypothetical protein